MSKEDSLFQTKRQSSKHVYYTSMTAELLLPVLASEQGNVIGSVRIYIAYYTSKSGIWLVISRVAPYFHEPKASANTAYE